MADVKAGYGSANQGNFARNMWQCSALRILAGFTEFPMALNVPYFRKDGIDRHYGSY
jgi:hypothetical protein